MVSHKLCCWFVLPCKALNSILSHSSMDFFPFPKLLAVQPYIVMNGSFIAPSHHSLVGKSSALTFRKRAMILSFLLSSVSDAKRSWGGRRPLGSRPRSRSRISWRIVISDQAVSIDRTSLRWITSVSTLSTQSFTYKRVQSDLCDFLFSSILALCGATRHVNSMLVMSNCDYFTVDSRPRSPGYFWMDWYHARCHYRVVWTCRNLGGVVKL